MRTFSILVVVLGMFLTLGGCRPEGSVTPRPSFTVSFDNEANPLQARFAAFLTDEEGKVQAFRWLNLTDTSHLQIRFSDYKAYDCTVVKMTVTATSTYPDTVVELTTYRGLKDQTNIRLGVADSAVVITDLKVRFSGLTSLDTIIVPDGLTFIRPQSVNSYFGHYNIRHYGDFWLRAKFDGEDHWRYMVFNNYLAGDLSVELLKAQLPTLSFPNPVIQLPFTAPWKYQIQGEANGKLMPVGDLTRAPGNAVPVLGSLEVFRPENMTFSRYRVQLKGAGPGANPVTYYSDRFYTVLPQMVTLPSFDVETTILGDNRSVGVQCNGQFDALLAKRGYIGSMSLYWTAFISPVAGGIVTHRLPDVPEALSGLFPVLKNYGFNQPLTVSAESYDALDGLDAVQSAYYHPANYWWQAQAGLTGIERSF